LTATTFFTFVVFAGSALLLIIAGICYIPLLCYIQGNLKEYVCHKVDKRIAEVIKRRNKERLAKAAALAKKEAMGDFSHLKNKKGELIAQPLPQPTLPNLSVDDDFDDKSSMRTRGPPPSTYTQDYYDYKADYPTDYPPMPAYNQAYQQHQGQGAYYNSTNTFVEDDYPPPNMTYDDDHGSTAHLALSAAPFAQPVSERPGSGPQNYYGSSGVNGSYVADPHDVYQGRTVPNADYARRSPQPQTQSDYPYQMSGMAGGYGEAHYASPTSYVPSPHSQYFNGAGTHSREESYGYDYNGQGQVEQVHHSGRGVGRDGGGTGYAPHAM